MRCFHIIFINLVFQLTNAAKLHSYELKNKYKTRFFSIFVASVAQRIFVKKLTIIDNIIDPNCLKK